MSKAVQLFPYAVSTALSLDLSDFDDPAGGELVDVRELKQPPTNGEGSSAPSHSYDASATGWRKLSFRLTATLASAEIERILPATSSLETDTALVVLMTCAATRLRHGVRLRLSKDGRWTGHAVVQRHDVRGMLTLRPQLVRTTGIPTDGDLPFATRAGSVIAVGDDTTIYIDVVPVRALESTIRMAWEDFANSDHAWRREHPDDVFHLEPLVAEPRLYLNSRYTHLREIMESDAKRGALAVLRDTTAAMIAQPALLQMATVAVASLAIDEDGQSVSTPPGWRADLLASILPRLYPEEDSEEDRLHRAAHEIRESDGAASLLGRLGSVVQEMVASYRTVEAIVRLHEASQVNEEPVDG